MVFQQALLLKWRTILDNVLLPAEIVGLPMKAARSRARDLLNLVGLAGYEDKYPQQLSGGMQHRTAIARALAHIEDCSASHVVVDDAICNPIELVTLAHELAADCVYFGWSYPVRLWLLLDHNSGFHSWVLPVLDLAYTETLVAGARGNHLGWLSNEVRHDVKLRRRSQRNQNIYGGVASLKCTRLW